MKKYLIHLIYLLIIGILAVMSRMKTNELETKLKLAEARALELTHMARAAEQEAKRQAELARLEAKKAMEAVEEASRLYEKCINP